VAVLVLVGLVAAAAAAVLMQSLKAGGHVFSMSGATQVAPGNDVEVLVAARNLQPMAVIDESAWAKRKIPRDTLPDGYMTDQVQVVGHVLMLPVTANQAFTAQHFARKNAAALASAIPEGRRAVTLSLSGDAAMSTTLYPGCIVDVVASLELPAQEGKDAYGKEMVSVILLQGVEVLAVEDKTVLSEGDSKAASGGGQYAQRRLVTLQVAPKEAELLQLVRASKGEISLTMRNPTERSHIDSSSTSLSQISELFSRRAMPSISTSDVTQEPPASERPQWSVVVLHGNNVEKQTYEMPASLK
jgi:Flp pilus assembly protein CpaB